LVNLQEYSIQVFSNKVAKAKMVADVYGELVGMNFSGNGSGEFVCN
jgi:hypothetical protein